MNITPSWTTQKPKQPGIYWNRLSEDSLAVQITVTAETNPANLRGWFLGPIVQENVTHTD